VLMQRFSSCLSEVEFAMSPNDRIRQRGGE
jgi:hypothetical protein